MDVGVLPSVLPEGMPMVLLEAMSAGVPIPGSRIDRITDVICHQQNGLLFDPADATSLAKQIQRILTNEVGWNALRKECAKDYAENFSEKAMASGVARIYDEVLRARLKQDRNP